jgi:heme-degrading monooxygenase HmoA
MHVRIVRAQTRPGQADELARRWKEGIAPRLKSAPGFRAVYLAADRAADRLAGVSVWDAKPGAEMDQAVRAFGEQVQDILAGPPAIEDYEVLEHF